MQAVDSYEIATLRAKAVKRSCNETNETAPDLPTAKPVKFRVPK